MLAHFGQPVTGRVAMDQPETNLMLELGKPPDSPCAAKGAIPVSVGPGEVFVEPPRVNMTGSNEGSMPATTILFYVCDPEAPFADPVP